VRDVINSNIGVAIANLANANVIGGISANASLMKMKLAAQMQIIVPAKVNEIKVLFVAAYLLELNGYMARVWNLI